ncbi:sulfur carrier protein ThiS [Mesorhizobium sp. M2D.F.Ca.ET.185.01.1.1]|uniref:sulfur carrier protein ThiS n=1 Tax=unclassified Mesorhizobium TaxID=325217 RepID=UPI000FCA21EE|nr:MULTISPECIES: sulfur carrier protein ThiS [unclassified Mesorhizobium]TGP77355.1 sulfur carrier protein ThiS [bacterium M00.F.Ca.ET.227.01.1.1]TGP93149.1 sulfur carrier protein ThiS [bacterium M00.F.Ca.ET.222.01.1.1]TGP96695.1 sulfur carrier protein ThiS [bacterium M00.F.Ca.ET.221.01.1.1]TGT95031.1 sulfur carrier protein ThiS [bacterium M00.F.Ca.ET.163.01.1.1]TGU18464.1 sulfur carrier protein ThiS [bacterium M00.F.Ca.ET.156.01.1.1]TGU49907.1 sulfur carrier protein ThiS [bacterium M00.F.Ca.
MKLIVNGQSHEVAAETLAALLAELDFQGGWLATALNGDVVPARERDRCQLTEGDRIEILSPMKGG